MDNFCIPKDKMKIVLSKIVDTKIEKVIDLDIDARAALFVDTLGKKDAKNFSIEFERALMSNRKRSLGDMLKKNLDATYRQKHIDTQQKAAIEKFIINKMLPLKGKSSIVSPKEIAKMSKSERTKILKRVFDEKEVEELNKRLDAVKGIMERQEADMAFANAEKSAQRELKYQTDKIESILGAPKSKKVGVQRPSASDILKMDGESRLDYLKKLGVKDSDKVNSEIEKVKSSLKKASDERRAKADIDSQIKRVEAIVTGVKRDAFKKIFPSSSDIVGMKSGERLDYLKKLGVENAEEMNAKIDDIYLKSEIAKEARKAVSADKRKLRSQEDVVKRFIGEKKVYQQRTSKKIDEIIAMKDEERLSFLQKHMTKMSAEEADTLIKKAMKTEFEKQIERDLDKMTNYKEMKAYIDRKIPQVSMIKSGVALTNEQTTTLARISDDIKSARIKMVEDGLESSRMEYGRKVMEMQDYANDIIGKNPPLSDTLLSISNIQRGTLTTGELSGIAIQGFPYVFRFLTQPVAGIVSGLVRGSRGIIRFASTQYAWKNLYRSLKALGKESAYKDMLADFITRDTQKLAKTANLRQTSIGGKLTAMEDDWMSNLFKTMSRSDNGIIKTAGNIVNTVYEPFARFHTAYLTGLRREAFDDIIRKMEVAGVEYSDKDLKYLGATINDATDGSTLGMLEHINPIITNVFFSFRKVTGDVKFFTVRPIKDTYKAIIGNQAEKIIAMESLKTIFGSVALSASVYELFKLASIGNSNIRVEDDPTSSDFGDVRINGETRFNFTGGGEWPVMLASRIIMGSYKDKNLIKKNYGTGYGEKTKGSAVLDVVRGKLAPTFSIFVDYLAGSSVVGEKFMMGATREDFKKAFIDGNEGAMYFLKTAAQREAFNRAIPITWQTVITLFQDDPQLAAMALVPMIGGVGSNTYGNNISWLERGSKEMVQFRLKKGYKKTFEAQELYNKNVNLRIDSLITKKKKVTVTKNGKSNSVFYDDLSDDEKSSMIESIKKDVKNAVFERYGYEYEKDWTPDVSK